MSTFPESIKSRRVPKYVSWSLVFFPPNVRRVCFLFVLGRVSLEVGVTGASHPPRLHAPNRTLKQEGAVLLELFLLPQRYQRFIMGILAAKPA